MAASGMKPSDIVLFGSVLHCVDSGAESGRATFDDGKLVWAKLIDADMFFKSALQCSERFNSSAVVEIPDRVKVNPKSIIKLALNAGRWLQYYGERCSGEVRAVEASAWKASTDPDVLARRILACLTPEEVARLPKTRSALGYNHNVLDAVGLGLWRLGRMGRGGRKIK